MTRRAYCWHGDCEAELEWTGGRWVCPQGHRLRQRLSPWLRDRIHYVQTDPAMLRRYFGDPP